MTYFLAIIIGIFCAELIFGKWENRYEANGAIVDVRVYPGDWNVFKTPMRKIYRPKNLSDMPYDIYVLTKLDRFRKLRIYTLANLDDEPEFTANLQRMHNEKRHENSENG